MPITKAMNKENKAIELIREYEPVEGYYLAFSGGKDSIVCYNLLLKAGVKFDAHYNSTTIDPPELLRFIKRYYPDVEWHYPTYKGKPTNFYNLVKAKGLPSRNGAWCCEALKEGSGYGRIMIEGVRAAESYKRSLRKKLEYFLKPYWYKKLKGQKIDIDTLENLKNTGRAKQVINIIFDWSDNDVWRYIRDNDLPYCNLYDQGWDRIGCIGCCKVGTRKKQREIELYPIYKANILKAIKYLMSKGKFKRFESAEDVFSWWVSNKSIGKYFGEKQQIRIKL
jgi:phosphoadenosine phosphosulfate reductase